MTHFEKLQEQLNEAEAEYRAASYALNEGEGSFGRLLEAREALENYLDKNNNGKD